MSDRSATAMHIGGTITGAKLAELIEAIEAEGVGPEYEVRFGADEGEVEAYLKACAAAQQPANLFDNERAGGQFENLEAACRELGLTYSRADDGHYAYSASVAFWRPGMAEAREWTGTVDGHTPHLSAGDIRRIMGNPASVPHVAMVERLEAELSLMDWAENVPALVIVEQEGNANG